MSRNHYETVTRKVSFAVLVQAHDPRKADGKATFIPGRGSIIHVRAVSLEELKRFARKMNKANGELFSALLALKGALETRDDLALANAKVRLENVRLLDSDYQKFAIGIEKSQRRLDKLLAPVIDLLPELHPDPELQESPAWIFSSEVSRIVGHSAQIVLWEEQGAFRPALFCQDLITALYLHTFFIAPNGILGFRACPYDGEQFFQNRPNQDYCSPAHREAHRVARFRARQKQDTTKGKKNGRGDGSQKTR
jgi:hypothetical protein